MRGKDMYEPFELTELGKLIEEYKNLGFSPSEKKAQIISFAYGNIRIHDPGITREMVEQEYEKLKATLK